MYMQECIIKIIDVLVIFYLIEKVLLYVFVCDVVGCVDRKCVN